MNFKDAYKSYNDEIKGDPKVLDTILNGKKENQKEIKKVFAIRPSFVGAMAAMVVLAVSVFGFNNFDNKNSEPKKTYIAAKKADVQKNIPAAEFKAENSTSDNSEKTLQNADYGVLQKEPVYSENKNPLTVEPVQAEISPLTDDGAAVDMPATAEMGFSDGDMPAYDEESVTTDDCYSYFGFDVTQKAKLPYDMTFGGNVIIDSRTSAETGEMEYCKLSIDAYSLNDPQRLLEICVTKQEDFTMGSGEPEYNINEETGELIGGKVVTDKMSFSVESQNVTASEVEEILISLKDF